MNILIPHKWLLEHLETDATPEQLQKVLSLAGPSVERINQTKGDQVYDIEVTTNRVDSMSVRGIAREAGVILSQFGYTAQLKEFQPREIVSNKDELLPLPTITNDPKLSKRISCVILKEHLHLNGWQTGLSKLKSTYTIVLSISPTTLLMSWDILVMHLIMTK
jgi:hypothetical protein